VYQLDVGQTTRYDRIYLGACANSRSKYLYRLLDVGGILIGPFQVGQAQQLRRVVRRSETQFNVEVLGSVQFASLLEPEPTVAQPPEPPVAIENEEDPGEAPPVPLALAAPPFAPPPRRGDAVRRASAPAALTDRNSDAVPRLSDEGGPLGLPGVPFEFSLVERPWTPERSAFYPASFRRIVKMGLLCRPENPNLPCFPTEIWVKHIFPLCHKHWFEVHMDAAPCTTPQKELPQPSKASGANLYAQ
jgi:hypothetical protein